MRLNLRLAAVGALTAALAACGAATTTAGPGTTESGGTTTEGTATGGTVRIGYANAPDTLNPGNGVTVEDILITDLTYDSPINIDFNGDSVPALATEWSASDDGLTWTLKIREGATWHDGEPLTAEDVAYSLNLWREGNWIYLTDYVDEFTSIEATDPTTVVMTTDTQFAAFDYRLYGTPVVPKHIWEALPDATTFTNDAMIGSGPFKLTEYQQGEFVRLEANKEYWGGAPHVDEVIFQTYDNVDAQTQALINGEVDMITEFPLTALSTLQNTPNVEVAQGSEFGGRFADIYFNVADPATCPTAAETEGVEGVCSGHPALKDVRVRQALATATNKQELLDVTRLGLGDLGLGLVPSAQGDWFASELLPEDYQFSLESAAQMLEDAGYTDTDGDGIRECPTADCGRTGDLTLRMNYPTSNLEHPRVSEKLKEWWEQIGLKIEIAAIDENALTPLCCPGYDYDVILWSWSADPDPEGLLGVLLCDEILSGFNETGYCNPDYDELFNQQTVETDPAIRREIIVDMQRMALEEAIYIIPWYEEKVQAFRTDTFTGWPTGFPILGLADPQALVQVRPAG